MTSKATLYTADVQTYGSIAIGPGQLVNYVCGSWEMPSVIVEQIFRKLKDNG